MLRVRFRDIVGPVFAILARSEVPLDPISLLWTAGVAANHGIPVDELQMPDRARLPIRPEAFRGEQRRLLEYLLDRPEGAERRDVLKHLYGSTLDRHREKLRKTRERINAKLKQDGWEIVQTGDLIFLEDSGEPSVPSGSGPG
jgi:hypothetical protein